MRLVNRSVLASVLVLSGVAAMPVIACSSSDSNGGGPGTGDEGGIIPGSEAGVDSSIATTPCEKASDCSSGVCNMATKLCVDPTCKDGVKNGTESDTDCGGDCDKCDTAKACKTGGDCTSAVCKDTGTGLKCQAPTNTDGAKNGNETGIDCGNTGNPKCPDGQGCKVQDDCTSDYCKAGVCSPILPADGVQNGTETDIDCGGVGNARCADLLKCKVEGDCTSSVCKDTGDGMGLRCQAPTTTDGKKNGAETDVDCGGGGGNPGCAKNLACVADGDCASAGCGYNNKCADSASCKAHYGGDTCGQGGAGGLGAETWGSCCETIPVTTTYNGAAQTVYMDKYPTTAGRMRVFLESVGYNVRAFVQGARAGGAVPNIPVNFNGTDIYAQNKPVLDASWDSFLPTGFDATAAGEISDCNQGGTCTRMDGECSPTTTCIAGQEQPGIYTAIRNHLGGTIFKNNSQTQTGCFVGSPGTHSFRFPADKQDGATPEQPQEVYDTKTLNCVDYMVAQAFCVWDGGRLETFTEWQTAYGPGATPWAPADTRTPVAIGSSSFGGCRFPNATDAAQPMCGTKWGPGVDNRSNQLADYMYSYEYPSLAATQQDYIVFLTAPGRLSGRGPLGHADLLGAGFEITSSVNTSTFDPAVPNSGPFAARHRWSGNGSWEVHGYDRTYGGNSELLNKYGKLGMRCVKFAPN